eukprot:3283206-Pyramimonas_sp.AAC.1
MTERGLHMSAGGIRETGRTLATGKGFDKADELQFLGTPSHFENGDHSRLRTWRQFHRPQPRRGGEV